MDRQVLVALASGDAVSGVLVATPGDRLVLRGCQIHDAGAQGWVAADGEIVVEAARVNYVQVL